MWLCFSCQNSVHLAPIFSFFQVKGSTSVIARRNIYTAMNTDEIHTQGLRFVDIHMNTGWMYLHSKILQKAMKCPFYFQKLPLSLNEKRAVEALCPTWKFEMIRTSLDIHINRVENSWKSSHAHRSFDKTAESRLLSTPPPFSWR